MDVADGDVEAEDADPAEEDDAAEEDDPPGQYDEDHYTACLPRGDGPCCTISDSDYCLAGDDRVISGPAVQVGHTQFGGWAGNEDDGEGEPMMHDVPVLPVFSAEYDIFTDKPHYRKRRRNPALCGTGLK